ncbi:MAG TPA: dUTP diphosphatase [Lachnospiraceae bacterium]|nr:dUTP diphosphatase [Lachnospiraceae bacterium]
MLPNIKENTAIVFKEYPDYAKDFIAELINIILVAILEGYNANVIPLSIELCNPEAKMPTYANKGDAGMDVYALEDYTIKPGETKLIPTGIKVAIPEGYELQVRPKSGRALKTKLRVANTPGTIDSGYRSEVGVIIENIEAPIQNISYHYDNDRLVIDSILHGKDYYIGKGEKFAQLVLCKVYEASFTQVTDITTVKGDRGGGFGSSGLK